MAKTLSGLSPRQEQQKQEQLLNQLEVRVMAGFKREINRAMNQLAKSYFNDIEYAKAETMHKANIENLLKASWSTAFNVVGRRMLSGFKKYDPRQALKAQDVYEQAFQAYLTRYTAAKIGEITDTTFKQAAGIIEQALADGKEQGLGQDKLAELIQSEVAKQGGTLSTIRARVIARTEMHSAAMASNHEAAKSTGLDLIKGWVASRGERTRPAHARADGQVVGMNDNFIVDDEPLFVPGDPNGSASNIINCRCGVVYLMP